MPDGTVFYGLLMEYIDGQALDYMMFRKLSPSRQIKLVNEILGSGVTETWFVTQIQSFRQGIRVLDLADVTQLDWHRGQILVHTDPSTNIDHAVLIDFAYTFQTTDIEVINRASNYLQALFIFFHDTTEFGLDRQWVLDHFGEPDYWDSTCCFTEIDGESKVLEALPLFPYISVT